MAGIMATEALVNASVTDFLIVEHLDRIGGRASEADLGTKDDGSSWIVELDPNWVSGIPTEDGPINPIWELVSSTIDAVCTRLNGKQTKKYGVRNRYSQNI